MTEKLILKNEQAPGDVLMLTATVRDLCMTYPNRYQVDVRTSFPALWEYNPYLTKIEESDSDVRLIKMHYPIINESNEGAYHFIHGFTKYLEDRLDIKIKVHKFWGDIHFSDEEKSWISMVHQHFTGEDTPFWLICTGGKTDYSCIAAGSRVMTDSGYKRIENVSKSDRVMTEWGFSKCDGSIFNGTKECVEIKTDLNSIKCTRDHRLKVLMPDGNIIWKESSDINIGDYILCKRGNLDNLKHKQEEDVIDRYELKGSGKKLLLDYRNNGWYFDRVVEISDVGEFDVYDILNSETFSFVVEGYVAHNCKWWIYEYAQEVVDHFKDRIQFVQFGATGEGHYHPPLKGVINLVGKTDLRMFMRLMYHASGVICPITFAMHLAAAMPAKDGSPARMPCIVTAGGREPSNFTCYTNHQFLHSNGALNCCDNGGCWKSRIDFIDDGDDHKNGELCENPVEFNGRKVQKCMHDCVRPEDVIRAIEKYYCDKLQYLPEGKKTIEATWEDRITKDDKS